MKNIQLYVGKNKISSYKTLKKYFIRHIIEKCKLRMPKKLTRNEFIEKAKQVHGDKFDYSEVIYENSNKKVKIICHKKDINGIEHGVFFQKPNAHMCGDGCPKCGGTQKLTTEEFIIKAKSVHGDDKFDYSDVFYECTKKKVKIICHKKDKNGNEHGVFFQKPNDHLCGKGCPKCGGTQKITKEDFIERANLKHGVGRYYYSQIEKISNIETKVCIICPKPNHGQFWQTPKHHMDGCGCPKCGGVKKLTKEDFIEKSNLKHGIGTYNYSKIDKITNNKKKVCIVCPKPNHGEFWQTPNTHLKGCGCPKCGIEKQIEKKSSTKEEFITKAKQVHGDNTYNYSKVIYNKSDIKVCIVCPKMNHGEFWQTPNDHLRGSGCPNCRTSKIENAVVDILNKHNFLYKKNYRGFVWLKNKQRLELDFYLSEHNIAIECQGEQHFVSAEHWGGEKQLKYIQQNDQLKKRLCEEHGVSLFYINYDDNVEEKLNQILSSISQK